MKTAKIDGYLHKCKVSEYVYAEVGATRSCPRVKRCAGQIVCYKVKQPFGHNNNSITLAIETKETMTRIVKKFKTSELLYVRQISKSQASRLYHRIKTDEEREEGVEEIPDTTSTESETESENDPENVTD